MAFKVGIDLFANILAVVLFFSAVAWLLTFGKELKPAKFIVTQRRKIYEFAYSLLHGILVKYLKPEEDSAVS